MKKYFLILLLIPIFGFAEPTLLVHTRRVGEPVNRPLEVKIKLRCSKKNVIEIHNEKYCEFVSLDKKMSEEKAIINVLNYNPDNGACEKPEAIELSFKSACN